MRSRILLATAGIALIAGGAAPALAAGQERNGETTGDCISDGFYGNEPNIEGPFAPGGPQEQEPGERDGRVVRSAAPGPKVFVPATGGTRDGASVGEANQLLKAAGVQNVAAFCKSLGQ